MCSRRKYSLKVHDSRQASQAKELQERRLSATHVLSHIQHTGIKDGTNLEFHSNRISQKNRIRIEYEYSMASNLIITMNSVKMSCRFCWCIIIAVSNK